MTRARLPSLTANSTKGASEADPGYPHAGSRTLEDRASHMCAHGRVSPFVSLHERQVAQGGLGQSGGQRATWANVGARGRSQAGTR